MLNKQAKLIDGQALLEDMKEKKRSLRDSLNFAKREGEDKWADELREQMQIYSDYIEAIESGRFYSPSESESTVAERAKASIADRYKNALHGWHNPVDRAAGSYYNGYLNGVGDTLRLLDITIPGINAPEKERVPHINITDLPFTRHSCSNPDCPVCDINATEKESTGNG